MFQPLLALSPEAEETVKQLRESFAKATSRELSGHKKKVHSVSWNCTGQRIASGSVDQTARVWAADAAGRSAASAGPVTVGAWSSPVNSTELRGHTNSVDQLTWHPSHPDLLATASADKSVKLWDTRTSKCTATVNTSGENINIVWSPDGEHLAVGNKEDLLTIIDTRKFKNLKNSKFPFEVNEIGWNVGGDLFFLTTGLGTVEVLRYPGLDRIRTLAAHTANCYCLEFDPTGNYFATGAADALVNLWDAREFVCVRTFGRLDWPIRTLSFSADGSLLASASEDLVIDISHVETGASVVQILCTAATNAASWHPKLNLLAFAGDEKDKYDRDLGLVRIWGFPPAAPT